MDVEIRGVESRSLDGFLTLSQASRQLPGRPHTSTVYRWCMNGYRGVYLKYYRFGSRIAIHEGDLLEFARQLAGGTPAQYQGERTIRRRPKRSKAARENAVQRAEAELKRRGV